MTETIQQGDVSASAERCGNPGEQSGPSGDRQHEEPVFFDTLFRQKRKHGEYRVIDPPALNAPVADTHAHLQLLADPALALARAGIRDVRFVCTIVDVHEDGLTTYDQLNDWRFQGALNIARLVTRRC
ncbi:nitrate ABC transporter substrate-binding protein [Raoultibacter phocaeensis]|uniref:nitrate ABC transporter substrate-binding protein n=1 Tax=Raoultibacter phocaeensis TaxID=2479841 RepID=UPI0021049AFE|nr:nitrate ABC transporter substrate-binding protein [Raoultibacter phocaeensis]